VLYLLALAIKLFGASELALRVPGMIAGVLTVLATCGLGQRMAGRRTAAIAALLVALSPFAILFAPTAFTDGWLTLFLVLAAWAALAGRPGWAGVLLGLACASKQQGVMGAPLIAALVVAGALEHEGPKATEGAKAPASWRGEVRSVLAALGLAMLGFAVVFGAVTYWDSLRWHNRPSYWDQSLRTYGGVVLAPLAQWPERAAEWAGQVGYWFGAWPITALLIAAGMAGSRIRRRTNEPMKDGAEAPSPLYRWLLQAYILAYLLVHLAFTFQPWDRYLLPILPLVCVLLGQRAGPQFGGEAMGRGRACRRAALRCLPGPDRFHSGRQRHRRIPRGGRGSEVHRQSAGRHDHLLRQDRLAPGILPVRPTGHAQLVRLAAEAGAGGRPRCG
jgi:4-amino-4-deoxy-L-arabinose transferase-like glycosyltransferase